MDELIAILQLRWFMSESRASWRLATSTTPTSSSCEESASLMIRLRWEGAEWPSTNPSGRYSLPACTILVWKVRIPLISLASSAWLKAAHHGLRCAFLHREKRWWLKRIARATCLLAACTAWSGSGDAFKYSSLLFLSCTRTPFAFFIPAK